MSHVDLCTGSAKIVADEGAESQLAVLKRAGTVVHVSRAEADGAYLKLGCNSQRARTLAGLVSRICDLAHNLRRDF